MENWRWIFCDITASTDNNRYRHFSVVQLQLTMQSCFATKLRKLIHSKRALKIQTASI